MKKSIFGLLLVGCCSIVLANSVRIENNMTKALIFNALSSGSTCVDMATNPTFDQTAFMKCYESRISENCVYFETDGKTLPLIPGIKQCPVGNESCVTYCSESSVIHDIESPVIIMPVTVTCNPNQLAKYAEPDFRSVNGCMIDNQKFKDIQ